MFVCLFFCLFAFWFVNCCLFVCCFVYLFICLLLLLWLFLYFGIIIFTSNDHFIKMLKKTYEVKYQVFICFKSLLCPLNIPFCVNLCVHEFLSIIVCRTTAIQLMIRIVYVATFLKINERPLYLFAKVETWKVHNWISNTLLDYLIIQIIMKSEVPKILTSFVLYFWLRKQSL